MNKGIELTPSQIEAYERGATMFILPCPTDLKQRDIMSQDLGFNMLYSGYISKYIEVYSPVQVGDKDIVIKEKHTCDNFDMQEDMENKSCKACYSRYSFAECVNIKVIKVQDIEWAMEFHFQRFYNRCMEERNINRTYKDNDYVFSVEFKR